MTAQDLLNFLLAAQQAGADLNTLTVIAKYCVYDCEGQGEEGEKYPSTSFIDDHSLILL